MADVPDIGKIKRDRLEKELEDFELLCSQRYFRSNLMSASIVIFGYACLVFATLAGILSREWGGREAACGTFLATFAMGLEQSFRFSDSADVQEKILAEAGILLSTLRGSHNARLAMIRREFEKLRRELASLSRRSRFNGLTNFLHRDARTAPHPVIKIHEEKPDDSNTSAD